MNEKVNEKSTHRLALLALLAAAAMILGYVEAILPLDFGIPGVKPGLCNIVILITLVLFSWREAVLVSIVRILAVGLMFGNIFSISYSLAGSLLAIFVMTVLIHSGRFGFIGISASGGASHGIGQMLLAKIVIPSLPFAGYLSVLILSGIFTGCITGLIAWEIYVRVSGMSKGAADQAG